jgi:hypothetical protein
MILVWIKQKRILTLKLQEQWQKRLKKMQRCTAKAERRTNNKIYGHLKYNIRLTARYTERVVGLKKINSPVDTGSIDSGRIG